MSRQPNTDKLRAYYQAIEEILQRRPELDRGDLLHAFFCLEQPPLERLKQGLRRGRAAAIFKQRAGLSKSP